MNQVVRDRNADFALTTNSTLLVCYAHELPFKPIRPPEPIQSREPIPNEETAKAIRAARAGKNVVRCESVDDLFRKLGI